MIEAHGISDVGCVRHENQDRILIDHALGLYIVADGMGGHRHGEVAAELAIATIRYYIESSKDRFDVSWPFGYNFDQSIDANRISTAIRLANRQVWRHAEQGPEFAGMGTTVAAVLINDGQAVVANVGDSRVYLFRQGEISQLTIDDTWIQSFAARGLMAPSDLANHPMRNVLTQAAGSQEAVDVHIEETVLKSGDCLILTSDGCHGMVPDQQVQVLLNESFGLPEKVDRLLAAAKQNGGPDNVSVVVLSYFY